jgi:hypothetical protein
MDQERVAEEHVACFAGGQGRRPVRACIRRRRRRLGPGQSVVPGRGQHPGGVKMRTRTDSGRRAGLVDVAEQVQHQQPAGAGVDVDLLVPVPFVAGLEVPARVAWIGHAREAHRNRAPDTLTVPPAPGPDQLIEGLPQGRPGPGLGERAALGARDPHHRLGPGGRVLGHPALAEIEPDQLPAGPHHFGRHRAPDGDVPVGDEGLHLAGAEHGVRMASPPLTPPFIKRRRRAGPGPGSPRPRPAGTGPPAGGRGRRRLR